jgi:hypothetical protein
MPAPRTPNTSAATATSVKNRKRAKHDKWAAEMREWGWTCTPPEDNQSNEDASS